MNSEMDIQARDQINAALAAEIEHLRARVTVIEGELAPLRETITLDDIRKSLADWDAGCVSTSRFVEYVRAAAATIARTEVDKERERCAKIAETYNNSDWICCNNPQCTGDACICRRSIAAAIRTRT